MTALELWQGKILQLLRAAASGSFARWYSTLGRGGLGPYTADTRELVELLTDAAPTRADHIAMGADRPEMGACSQPGGDVLATHPLAGAPITLGPAPTGVSVGPNRGEDQARRLLQERYPTVERLRRFYLAVYRHLRDDVAGAGTPGRQYSFYPADKRAPDHSTWEHSRLTAALAFTRDAGPLRPACEPWLLSFEVGPVKNWVAAGRSTRDLWAGSLLLSELSFAALTPIIQHYGPDAVLKPDLNGNPRLDRWLRERGDEVLEDPWSHASTVVNNWTALVPAGGEGDLPAWRDLARDCERAVRERWDELVEGEIARFRAEMAVPNRDGRQLTEQQIGQIAETWAEQVRWGDRPSPALTVRWVASPWRLLPGADSYGIGGALPFQELPPEEARAARARAAEIVTGPGGERLQRQEWLTRRRAAFAPWMGGSDLARDVPPAPGGPRPNPWTDLEQAREVYARTRAAAPESANVLERGFDYLPTLRRLDGWAAVRKDGRTWPRMERRAGEACTCCRYRVALGWEIAHARGRPLDVGRSALRDMWTNIGKTLNEPRFGAERLCGVCLFRRRLLAAHEPRTTTGSLPAERRFERIWAGDDPTLDGLGRLRVPFPSTAAVASQRFVRALLTTPSLEPASRRLADVLRGVDWGEHAFPGALPGLQADSHPLARFDAQIFHADAVESELRRQGRSNDTIRQVREAITSFLSEASKALGQSPTARLAVVKVDGDRLGRLLAGGGERARWDEVIHPDVVEQLRCGGLGWEMLLGKPRQFGPPTQAFLTRALADFAHRVVPWVVEREFHGRLVYAGGDDVLALVDAQDAIPLVARLHQLYTSPWVLDRLRTRNGWRHRFDTQAASDRFDPVRDRDRFQIPALNGEVLPLRPQRFVDPISCIDAPAPTGVLAGEDAELFALPGPNAGLSAGIVYGHFKDDLGALIEGAEACLLHAKARKGGIALSLWSRSGEKGNLHLCWRPKTQDGTFVAAHEALLELQEALKDGRISRRLPYKLREPLTLWSALEQPDEKGPPAKGEPEDRALLRRRLVEEAMREGRPHDRVLGTTLLDLVLLFGGAEPGPALAALRSLGGDT